MKDLNEIPDELYKKYSLDNAEDRSTVQKLIDSGMDIHVAKEVPPETLARINSMIMDFQLS